MPRLGRRGRLSSSLPSRQKDVRRRHAGLGVRYAPTDRGALFQRSDTWQAIHHIATLRPGEVQSATREPH